MHVYTHTNTYFRYFWMCCVCVYYWDAEMRLYQRLRDDTKVISQAVLLYYGSPSCTLFNTRRCQTHKLGWQYHLEVVQQSSPTWEYLRVWSPPLIDKTFSKHVPSVWSTSYGTVSSRRLEPTLRNQFSNRSKFSRMKTKRNENFCEHLCSTWLPIWGNHGFKFDWYRECFIQKKLHSVFQWDKRSIDNDNIYYNKHRKR